MTGCLSSGSCTASTQVAFGRHKAISMHVNSTANHSGSGATAAFVVTLYDGTDTSGVAIAKVAAGRDHTSNTIGPFNFETDLHGVVAEDGLYLHIAGTGGTVFVHFL